MSRVETADVKRNLFLCEQDYHSFLIDPLGLEGWGARMAASEAWRQHVAGGGEDLSADDLVTIASRHR
jgi:hypothetical protein